MRHSNISAVLCAAVSASLVLPGCPQLLEDPFETLSSASSSGARPSSGTGGSGGTDSGAGGDPASSSGGDVGAGSSDASGGAGNTGGTEPSAGGDSASGGAGNTGGTEPSAGGDSASGGVLNTGGTQPSAGGDGTGGGGDPDPESSCSDGIMNGGEAGVDCGGACALCTCNWSPFAAPELVTGLGIAQDVFAPSLSRDGLTLLFASGVPEALYVATRPDRGTAFSAATLLPGSINTSSNEGTPFLSPDGLTLFFYSFGTGFDTRDVWIATRTTTSGVFTPLGPLVSANSASTDHLPWVSADNLTLLLTSQRAGAGAADLWVATRTTTAEFFGAATALMGVNTASDEESGNLSSDGMTLYFASDRLGGLGDNDLWMATRTTVDGAFAPATNLTALNSNVSEYNVRLSPDQAELFFVSQRFSFTYQIWRSRRECL